MQDVLPGEGTLDLVQGHSLTSALRTELERMIFDGTIKAGERINESSLAAHFKTSRGPLREALQALGEQGLISFARNRGAFVRRLDLAEAEELYDVRAALDDEVGRKLAGGLAPAQADTLDALLAAMDADVKANDIARYYRDNLRFHDLLVQYAGNARLAAIYRRVIKELHLFRLQGLYASGAALSNVEHRAMLDAIRSGDADRAAQAMRRHVEEARVRMRKACRAAVAAG